MEKTVLITGANKGIGLETARQLARQSFRLILSGRDAVRLSEARERLNKAGLDVKTLIMDVGDIQSIQTAASELRSEGIRLDVLINNAAVMYKNDRQIIGNESEVLKNTLRINSYGPLRVSEALLDLMNRPARIINVSSGGGSMSDPVGGWAPAYCASKSLLNAITRHMAFQLAGQNISVNAVCPGWVKTDMGGSSAPRPVEKGAETLVWLASEAPISATGNFYRDKQVIPW